MKASSPFIMIEAYRMLAQKMAELGMDYPFHLGVTEAGEGEDGRIKSAIGIGSLLEDGIGDTVRVSLTEDSVHEIPVAYALVKKFNARLQKPSQQESAERIELSWNPLDRKRRESQFIFTTGLLLGGNYALGAIAHQPVAEDPAATLRELKKWSAEKKSEEPVCDLLFLLPTSAQSPEKLQELRGEIRKLFPEMKVGLAVEDAAGAARALETFDAVLYRVQKAPDAALADLAAQAKRAQKILQVEFPSLDEVKKSRDLLAKLSPALVSLESSQPIYDYRRLACFFHQAGISLPIALSVDAGGLEEVILEASSALGALLMDGIGDAVEVRNLAPREATRLEFNILQASRLRISKAEFIACPSCGRTLFDLQETTQRIKLKTGHLKGVKIAIMGCIVNGPGEMADADFGYVGGGPGRIHLYVGKECVEKNIPTEFADQKLIDLIKHHGRWVEPADEDAKQAVI
jgi:(E)-4-hydroxy-3-methylbut-2-enyl-diphosphate synthase